MNEKAAGHTGNEQALALQMQICNERGLHARASARFVRLAEQFDARITVAREGTEVEGTSIMGLMMLAAGPGTRILVKATGPEARAALDALENLVCCGFDEEEPDA